MFNGKEKLIKIHFYKRKQSELNIYNLNSTLTKDIRRFYAIYNISKKMYEYFQHIKHTKNPFYKWKFRFPKNFDNNYSVDRSKLTYRRQKKRYDYFWNVVLHDVRFFLSTFLNVCYDRISTRAVQTLPLHVVFRKRKVEIIHMLGGNSKALWSNQVGEQHVTETS